MLFKAKKYTWLLGLFLFLAGLFLFAYLGIYNRYWADDWCYNADLKELGFWGTLMGYWYIPTYAANRFSLTLFSGILNFFGVFGVQIMTPLVVVLWFTGLYWILENIRKILSLHSITRLHTLFAAATIVYYSIYLTPHIYQSIYWRSALLPYTAPTILGVWVFTLITFQADNQKVSQWVTVFTAIMAFLAGGFSEAGCATLISLLGVYVFVTYLNSKKEWAKHSLPVAVYALAAATLAMVMLIISPTVLHRIDMYEDRSFTFLDYPLKLLSNSFDFVKYSILDAPYPFIVFAFIFGLSGYLSNALDSGRIRSKTLLVSLFIIGFLTFLFVAASYAPSTFIERAPPAPRTRVISIFILMLGIAACASLLGYYMKQIFTLKVFEAVAVILLIVTYLYDARTILITTDKISIYAERAKIWDERDVQIIRSREQGILEVNVRAIDGRPVGGIRDFDDGPPGGFWINQCAARYYGVDAIYATGP